MKFGLYVPNFGSECSARSVAELAQAAEVSGWDGLFLWDQILENYKEAHPMVDPWVALAAAAMVTERIRLGTTVTAVARRRPWKLARETVTLDHLSNGRLTLSVGLGDPVEAEFTRFGEQADPKLRAGKLDEGLEILANLWSGNAFKFQGQHYRLERMRFAPPTIQTPRIPVWVGGWWPHKAPFRRAARWDGAFPLKAGGSIVMTPQDVRDLRDFIRQQRGDPTPFDLVIMGTTPGDDARKASKKLAAYQETGLTWWLESLYRWRNSQEGLLRRIRQGPPAL